jgi:hypothetical protein
MFYAPDARSLPDVHTSTVINELRVGKAESEKRYEALQVQFRDHLAQQAQALSKEKDMEATLRETNETNRMLMRLLAARDEEVRAARTNAETVKTEHGEGDVDEPSNDKIPELQADSDEDEEIDDEDGRGAPEDQMPSMPWPLPFPQVLGFTGAKLYEGEDAARSPARVEDIQGGSKPSTSRRPADTCSSGNAGTGSPDMNKQPRPSASEESVTSRNKRSASHGPTHEQPHQAHEHQEQDAKRHLEETQAAMLAMANSVKELAESINHQNAVARGREHCARGFGGPPLDATDQNAEEDEQRQNKRQEAYELSLRVTAISKMQLSPSTRSSNTG